jgi:hypothetical protein
MEGRHRSLQGARKAAGSPVVLLSSALVVVVAAALSLTYLKSRLDTTDCDSATFVEVAAAPAVAPMVARLADEVTGSCFQLDVRATDSATVLDSLGTPTVDPPPQVWIPESSWWLRQAQAGGVPRAPATGTSIASSPVVLALTSEVASRFGWPGKKLTWSELLLPDARKVQVGLADPAADPVGLSALLEIHKLASGRAGTEVMRGLSANTVPVGTDLSRRLPAPGLSGTPLDGFFTSEQVVSAYNQGRGAAVRGGQRLVAVYPDAATPTLDYPFVVLPGASDGQRQVAQRLLSVLLRGVSPDSGLRAVSASVALPDVDTVDSVLNDWTGVNLSARLLGVIDVSGSMAEAAGRGQTRLAATVQAAARLLGLLRETTETGLWEFATNLDGDRDYKQVYPVSPIRDHRGDMFAALNKLQPIPHGDTGLYDTTLAAYSDARAHWTAGRLNVVVIATDGRNDDPAGIGIDQLVAELRKLHDARRPLQIIYVGIGPDVDEAAMKRISEVTGGRTFVTRDGSGVDKMFFDALTFLVGSA